MDTKNLFKYIATGWCLLTWPVSTGVLSSANAAWADLQYKNNLQQYGNQNAQEKYQQLACEALNTLGLAQQAPQISRLVKKLKPSAPDYDSAACQKDGVIFINEEYLDQQKIGMQRLTIFHEYVHLKQFLNNILWRRPCNTKKYKSSEHEADIESARLGNCWQCTMEFSTKAANRSDKSPRAQKLHELGYATKEEFLALAAQQKESGTCCQCHQ